MNLIENAPRGLALAGFLVSSSASNDIDRPITPQYTSDAAATPDPASDPRLSSTRDAIAALALRSRTMPDVAAIRPAAVDATHQLLDTLLEGAIQSRLPWETPHVATEGGGDLTLRWSAGGARSLSLHLTGTGPIEFLQAWGSDLREMADGPLRTGAQLLQLWRWLHEG